MSSAAVSRELTAARFGGRITRYALGTLRGEETHASTCFERVSGESVEGELQKQ